MHLPWAEPCRIVFFALRSKSKAMNTTNFWSRLPGFFGLDVLKRRTILQALPLNVREEDYAMLDRGLSFSELDVISENVIGAFVLPLSCAVNFVVDHEAVIVPMAIEEPSIVAACSKMAKLTAENGGFITTVSRPVLKGQIQLFAINDVDKARYIFAQHQEQLIEHARVLCAPIEARGGGLVDLQMRVLPSAKIGPIVLIEPLIDVVDAMGANIVNTVVEALSEKVAALFDATQGVRILSNYCDQRVATASCTVRFDQIATDVNHDNGEHVATRIEAAHALAEADTYRACTHNKGILNGVDAVAVATGNDFRAIEAAAHAYAARLGTYGPLTSLTVDRAQRIIYASLSLPLAVGVVGGLMKVHPGVRFAHQLLGRHATNSRLLSSVMVSVGLSQCLAALLALCQDGIQKGHMKLHKKKLA